MRLRGWCNRRRLQWLSRSLRPAEIPKIRGGFGVHRREQSGQQVDHPIEVAAIHDAVVRVGVADRHDEIHGRHAAIALWISAESSP